MLDGGLAGLNHGHSSQWASQLGHAAFEVDGLERVQPQFTEDGHVVLIPKRTNHQNTRTKFHFHRGMGAHFDHGVTTVCWHGKSEGLPNEVAVTVIIGVHNDDTASANHLRPRGRNDHLLARVGVPSHVNELGFARDPLNLCIGDGCAFHRVVDVWPQVLNHVTLLEQIDENGLRHAPVVRGIGEVFSIEIT